MRPELEACLSLSAAFLPKGYCQREVSQVFPPLLDGNPNFSIENGITVSYSLKQFVDKANGADVARQLVQAYTKNGATLPDDNFYVTARCAGGGHQSINNINIFPYPLRSFYQDGQYGLALMWKAKRRRNPSWLEVVSFYSSQQIKWYNTKLNDLTFPEPAPVIVQIQGYPTQEKQVPVKIKNKILALQQDFFIDIALVELLIEWCVRNRLPTLYMLPASMNKYWREDLLENMKRRFETRYDGIARHFGFTLQSNGLWGLDLRPIRLANGV